MDPAARCTWTTGRLTACPPRPVVARVRPAGRAGARLALAAGLRRAPDLDGEGEDGPDEVHLALPDDRRPR